jgi:hypothetical protein
LNLLLIMSKIYIYFTAFCLIVIGFGAVFVNIMQLYDTILAINANVPVIEIDNGIAFVPIFIGCGTLGLAFFKVFAITDATDNRRSTIMNNQFMFMGVCLILSAIGYFSFSYVFSAILDPKGYDAKTVYVGRSFYRVTEWRLPSPNREPTK